jgi:hypothetical protein
MARKDWKSLDKTKAFDRNKLVVYGPRIERQSRRIKTERPKQMPNTTKTNTQKLAAIPGDVMMEFIVRVPLNQCTVATSTKGDNKGAKFWNLPYSCTGTFGQEGAEEGDLKPAYIKGGRVIIPAEDREKTKTNAAKEMIVDTAALARLGIKI